MKEVIANIFSYKLFWATTFVFGIYFYLKFVTFNYWKRKGVPHKTPLIPLGNTWPLVTGEMNLGELSKNIYERFKMHPYCGLYIFHEPVLMINDLDLVQHILVKDYLKFEDRGVYDNKKLDSFGTNSFYSGGERWKFLRQKCSPLFTPGRIRQIYPCIEKVGDVFMECCENVVKENGIIDVAEMAQSYVLDVIGSVIFNLECNCLKNPKSEISEKTRMFLNQNSVKIAIAFCAPRILYFLRIPFTRSDTWAYFANLFREAIDQRKTSKVHRKDLLQLLIQLIEYGRVKEDDEKSMSESKTEKVHDKSDFTLLDACSQAVFFLAAGLETSASALSTCIYELALNQDVQNKLRQEINEFLSHNNGLLNYDTIFEMKYLEMVITETLRKYAVGPFLNRIAMEDYKVSNSNFVIPKGLRVLIPVYGIHHNEKIYPDPEIFEPERFNPKNIAQRHSHSFLVFGEGPKYCLGKRLALLEVKSAVVKFLSRYKFSVCEKTQIPLKLSNRSVANIPAGKVYLRIEVL